MDPRLLESVYEAAFAYELNKRGIEYTRQQPIKARYEEMVLDVGFRSDIIMEKKLNEYSIFHLNYLSLPF
ncbi:MAG: GxxExxY protein, partial [Bacteroidales bacterium]